MQSLMSITVLRFNLSPFHRLFEHFDRGNKTISHSRVQNSPLFEEKDSVCRDLQELLLPTGFEHGQAFGGYRLAWVNWLSGSLRLFNGTIVPVVFAKCHL